MTFIRVLLAFLYLASSAYAADVVERFLNEVRKGQILEKVPSSFRAGISPAANHNLNGYLEFLTYGDVAACSTNTFQNLELLVLNTCVDGLQAAAQLHSGNYLVTITTYSDSKCKKKSSVQAYNFPKNACAGGSVVNVVTEIPSGPPAGVNGIGLFLYDSKSACEKDKKGGLKGVQLIEVFAPQYCFTDAGVDVAAKTCHSNKLYAHTYTTTDGTCGGTAKLVSHSLPICSNQDIFGHSLGSYYATFQCL